MVIFIDHSGRQVVLSMEARKTLFIYDYFLEHRDRILSVLDWTSVGIEMTYMVYPEFWYCWAARAVWSNTGSSENRGCQRKFLIQKPWWQVSFGQTWG